MANNSASFKTDLYLYAKTRIEECAHKKGISQTRLDTNYYKPTPDRGKGALENNYFFLFCEHYVDRQYMKNIIKIYSSNTTELLKKVMCDYDVVKFLDKYTSLENFKSAVSNNDTNSITDRIEWSHFIEEIYKCAKYLKEYTINEKKVCLSELINSKPETLDEYKKLLNDIRIFKNHFYGVGEAVAYNWIKECGAEWLSKPDMHVSDIVLEMVKHDNTFSFDNEKKFPKPISQRCSLTKDELITLYMFYWSQKIKNSGQDNSITPFKLDRILYLYCTNACFYMEPCQTTETTITKEDLLQHIDIICNK